MEVPREMNTRLALLDKAEKSSLNLLTVYPLTLRGLKVPSNQHVCALVV